MTRPDQSLLDAMLAMMQRRGIPAVEVTDYAEASYNIGYCGTCSEIATSVRIFYRTNDGRDLHWDEEYDDLGQLIRELTDDPARREALGTVAVRQDDELKWERYYEAHDLGAALRISKVLE